MKKNILFTIFTSCVVLLSIKGVNALEINDGVYENQHGITMTLEQINNLRSLQFTDEQISRMTLDEFDMNKDLTGILVSSDTNYYKTSYIPKNAVTYGLNDSNYYIVNEEISEEEYNNSEISLLANCGTGDSCWQTEYKKLQTSIVQVGDQYRFRSDITWSQPPQTRSNDILAMAFNSTNISPVATSKYARYDWHMTRYDEELRSWYDDVGGTTFNSNHSNWRIDLGGYSVIMDLKNDEISADGEHIDQVWNQSAYMYFNVMKSTNVVIYVLDVYGSYQHAQTNVSLSSLAQVILDPSAYNIITFAGDISEEYDNMRKTHAQLSGIAW